MKTKLILLSFIFLSLVSSDFFAQQKLPKETSQQFYPIETTYDKFKDLTIVNMVIEVKEGRLLFTYFYEGKVIQYIPFLLFIKYIKPSVGIRYSEVKTNYYILADGERIKGTFERELNQRYEVFADKFYYQDVKKIAKSQSVEMQIGNDEFALTKKQINSIYNFIKPIQTAIDEEANKKAPAPSYPTTKELSQKLNNLVGKWQLKIMPLNENNPTPFNIYVEQISGNYTFVQRSTENSISFASPLKLEDNKYYFDWNLPSNNEEISGRFIFDDFNTQTNTGTINKKTKSGFEFYGLFQINRLDN